jgi:hypothetical protein
MVATVITKALSATSRIGLIAAVAASAIGAVPDSLNTPRRPKPASGRATLRGILDAAGLCRNGPEKQELLRLIGSLVRGPSAMSS